MGIDHVQQNVHAKVDSCNFQPRNLPLRNDAPMRSPGVQPATVQRISLRLGQACSDV